MIYQHPLAYLIGLEGLALMRAWGGDFDEQFVRARLAEVRELLDDESLSDHPGVLVEPRATDTAYRQWAPTYDDPGNELLSLDLPVIDEILDALPTGRAVDAACGTGRLAARLAARGYEVLGVDASVEMLEQGRPDAPGVRLVAGDLHRLPVEDDSVDLVTTALALTHVADLAPPLAEFARVLRPGGSAIVSDIHPELVYRGSQVKANGPTRQPQLADIHQHTVADYLRAVLAAGFRVRRFDELAATAAHDGSSGASRPSREIGDWRDWPWTLLEWVPEATAAAWDKPSMMVWHLQLD